MRSCAEPKMNTVILVGRLKKITGSYVFLWYYSSLPTLAMLIQPRVIGEVPPAIYLIFIKILSSLLPSRQY